MSEPSQRAFRAVALQRAASPEQLDHLVRITKPLDWILTLRHLHGPGRRADLGRRRTNSDPRRRRRDPDQRRRSRRRCGLRRRRPAVVDRRLGRRSRRARPADRRRSSKPTSSKSHASAIEVFHEREREHDDLIAKTATRTCVEEPELRQTRGRLQPGHQGDRPAHRVPDRPTSRISRTCWPRDYTTRRNVEDRRRDLTDAQQRKEDTQNEILKLRSQKTDLETQREREIQQSRIHAQRRAPADGSASPGS